MLREMRFRICLALAVQAVLLGLGATGTLKFSPLAFGLLAIANAVLVYRVFDGEQETLYIHHKVYFDGKVQSLSYSDRSICVVWPGEVHDFGPLEKREKVRCLDGFLVVNGEELSEGEGVVVEAGGEMKIRARYGEAAYKCIVG